MVKGYSASAAGSARLGWLAVLERQLGYLAGVCAGALMSAVHRDPEGEKAAVGPPLIARRPRVHVVRLGGGRLSC